MTPNKWMSKIYHAFTKYHNTIFMFGDTNQCDPVEKGSQIHHDYFTSVPISEMCPKRTEMKYKEGCARYDEQARVWVHILKYQKHKLEKLLNMVVVCGDH